MLLTELLAELSRLGITIQATATELRLSPKGASALLTPTLREALREHRAALLKPPAADDIALFRASVARIDGLLEGSHALRLRIINGVAYCEEHPANAKAATTLAGLQEQWDQVEAEIVREAEAQHEIEQRVLAGRGGYVCGICFSMIESGTCLACWPEMITTGGES